MRTTMLDRAMAYVEQWPTKSVFSLNELRVAAGVAIRSQYRLSQQMLASGLMERCNGGYRLPLHLKLVATERLFAPYPDSRLVRVLEGLDKRVGPATRRLRDLILMEMGRRVALAYDAEQHRLRASLRRKFA